MGARVSREQEKKLQTAIGLLEEVMDEMDKPEQWKDEDYDDRALLRAAALILDIVAD